MIIYKLNRLILNGFKYDYQILFFYMYFYLEIRKKIQDNLFL